MPGGASGEHIKLDVQHPEGPEQVVPYHRLELGG